jgi:hypothetical protein
MKKLVFIFGMITVLTMSCTNNNSANLPLADNADSIVVDTLVDSTLVDTVNID